MSMVIVAQQVDKFFVSKMENGKGVVISMQTCASTPTPSRYFSTHESIHNTHLILKVKGPCFFGDKAVAVAIPFL